MKIILLVSAIALLVLTTTAFAAFIYWGHPYMGVSHHKSGPYLGGQGSAAFGGCPYLQRLHEGLEPYGGDAPPHLNQGRDFYLGQGPYPSPVMKKDKGVMEI